jgi:photosystem II stability/assembly factor-like uncharacterized protein
MYSQNQYLETNTGSTSVDIVDINVHNIYKDIYGTGGFGVVKINWYDPMTGYAGWITEQIPTNLQTFAIASPENRGGLIVGAEDATLYMRNDDNGNISYGEIILDLTSTNDVLCLEAYEEYLIVGGENGLLYTGKWNQTNGDWIWTSIILTSFHIRSVAIVPKGTGYLVGAFGDENVNFISEDFFNTTTSPISSFANFHASHFCSDGTNVRINVAGDDMRIYQSVNSGATFTNNNFPYYPVQNIVSKDKYTINVCGFQPGELIKTTDNCQTWEEIAIPGNEVVNDIDINADCRVIGGGNNNFGCNRQKGGCLTLIFFKWTKRRLFFLAKKTIYVAVFYLCIIKLNGSKLCWGATCQG